MARLLVWSPEAIEDLEAIAAYIERDSAWYAKAVVSKDDFILVAAIVHGSRLLQWPRPDR